MQANNELPHQHAVEWIRMTYWQHVCRKVFSWVRLLCAFCSSRMDCRRREHSLGRHNVCQLSLSDGVALSAVAVAHRAFALSMHLIAAHVQPLCYKSIIIFPAAASQASQSENAPRVFTFNHTLEIWRGSTRAHVEFWKGNYCVVISGMWGGRDRTMLSGNIL